jgi:ribonuclease HII
MINPLDWDLGNVPPGVAWGGVDEAGRGAWAGPVVAAAAVLDPETVHKWGHVLREARDSKQLTAERREVLASELKSVLLSWAVAESDVLTIDRENILEATLSAMRKAVQELQVRPRMLFVDGTQAPRTGLPERLLVDGDATSCAVAAASILAKTHRDALMRSLDEQVPGYAFGQHKGYGTKLHQERLAELGASSMHRLSYAPVAAAQQTDEQVRAILIQTLEQCQSVKALQAWVESDLKPNYGRLKLVWVETLRRRYADRLAKLAYQEGLEE